jgi:hypothetical protein
MGFGAEIITLRQNRCIRRFKKHSAFEPKSAIDFATLNFSHLRTLNYLIKKDVVKSVDGRKFYLDVENSRKFKRSFGRWFGL